MENLRRTSPVKLPGTPEKTENRQGWEVVLRYQGEGRGPLLVDLSHCRKWDFQARYLEQTAPADILPIPESPGRSLFASGLMVNRLNRIQVSIWHLAGPRPAWPALANFTETTDGLALLALLGREVPDILAKVSTLDLGGPGLAPPFVLQGPVAHAAAQVAVPAPGGLLLALAAGYGQTVTEILLDAGREFGLQPAGETAATAWLTGLGGR